ncbi:MAG: RidA family protein [Anaerorhabdus sp.]
MFTQAYSSPNAPKALGPYSQAVKLGDFVYLSGQVPLSPETGEIVGTTIQEQTQQVLKNIEAVLMELNLELRHVLKTTVFMSDLKEFDGMNEIYGTYFQQPYPARSTVQVAALPKGAKIEIECIVIDTLAYEKQMAHSHEGCDGGCCGGEEEGCSGGCCGGDCD